MHVMPRSTRDDDLSDFGKAVERWRRRYGLSQQVVADLIGTHQRTLSDWLKKDGMPGAVYQVARLALLMGETTEGLLESDADLAPLRDLEYVQGLLLRVASPRVLRKYMEQNTDPSDRGSRTAAPGGGLS